MVFAYGALLAFSDQEHGNNIGGYYIWGVSVLVTIILIIKPESQ